MFNNVTNPLITGGIFIDYNTGINNTTKGGFELLKEVVAHGAFHNSGERFDPPKCHENTRVAVLQRIVDWILRLDPETRDAVIMWLYGPAGAGKSAIAQTIAEMLEWENQPVSSFFFLRHDPMRGNSKSLVPTLVYQMTLVLPLTFRETVVQSIERDPLIFTKSLETQFMTLVLNPMEQLFLSGFSSNHPYIMIIDGLDECDDRQMQSQIVDVAFKMQRRNRLVPLLFLICSRPEVAISVAFESHPSTYLSRLALDDTYLPDGDIRHFLNDKFTATKKAHRLRAYIPELWPTEEAIDTLVRKSSGQFIYASTVAKFVTDARNKPHDRLDIVLGLRPVGFCPVGREMPFAELDALYTYILSAVDDLDTVLKVIGLTLLSPAANILGSAISMNSRDIQTSKHLETLLGLESGDLHILLQDLGSLIMLTGIENIVKFLHASLEDFFFDQSRSKHLWINRTEMHGVCATLSLKAANENVSSPFDLNILCRIFHHTPLANPTPSLIKHVLKFSLENLQSSTEDSLLVSRNLFTILAGKYLQYLKSLTWEEVKSFRQDQFQVFDQYLESHLTTYYSHDDLVFLVSAVSELYIWSLPHQHRPQFLIDHPDDLNYICTPSQSMRMLDNNRLQLDISFYVHSTYMSMSEQPSNTYLEEISRYIQNPGRSGKLYLSSSIYSRAALTALKRLCNDCPWSSIPPRSLSVHDVHTRRSFPTKWRRISKKRNGDIRKKLPYEMRRKDFLDQVSSYTWHTENGKNNFASSVFYIAAVLLPPFLEKCQISDELTQLARVIKFGRRARQYSVGVRAAKRAIKQYLARVDGNISSSDAPSP